MRINLKMVHARTEAGAQQAAQEIQAAYQIAAAAPVANPVVYRLIRA